MEIYTIGSEAVVSLDRLEPIYKYLLLCSRRSDKRRCLPEHTILEYSIDFFFLYIPSL